MRKILLIVMSLLVAVIGVQAQDEDDLLELVSEYVDVDDPALAVQVSIDGETWAVARGMATEDRSAVVDDRFRIGSMSKTFTAVVALMLVEDDVFALDDLASEWLPDDVTANIANADQVTIRQLLAMRSGIDDYLGTDDFWNAVEDDPTYTWTELDVLTYAYDLDPLFAPDEGYEYSNTNYILLELILEEASGMPLHTFMRERIFEPFNMTDTYTQVSETMDGGFVNGYMDFDGDGTLDNVSDINDGAGLADGGLISTVGDVTIFYQALLHDQTLLNEDSMAILLDFQDDGEGARYSLGLGEWEDDGVTGWGHSGGVLGFLSIGVYLPESEATIIVLSASEEVDPADIMFDIVAELE